MITRRDWFVSSAALAYAGQAARGASGKTICIASGNGLRATQRAMDLMKNGADTLDAVIAGVNILELDPEETSVGFGGLPNEEGVTELDASVMHGPTRRCGAVGGVRSCRTPSKLAKIVMEQTDHIMLVGQGADKFAVEMGMPAETLTTEKSHLAWLVWKQSMRDKDGHSNWGPGLDSGPQRPTAELKKLFPQKIQLIGAYLKNKMIAGVINFYCNDKVVLVFYISHNPDFQEYRAVNLLFYNTIKDSIKKKLHYLDFGLFTVNMDPNWGLGRFKESFGARGILRDTFYLDLSC